MELLINRSESLNFDLTAKNVSGHTGFHLACEGGHTNVVEMLKDKSESLKIDLTAKDVQGYTGFQLAVGSARPVDSRHWFLCTTQPTSPNPWTLGTRFPWTLGTRFCIL